jgi:chromosome segregation ATPase
MTKEHLQQILKERDSKIEELEKEVAEQRQEICDLNDSIEEINKSRMTYDHDYSYKSNMQKEISDLTNEKERLEAVINEHHPVALSTRIMQLERTILDMVVK